MAADPGFIFYPGDYLRDTQCLSEKSQVAYDRIMCEHMRNICISPQQLKFFTKRLNDEEKEEILMVLTFSNGGYFINWVVDSIIKRREYSESRRNNRSKQNKKEDQLDNYISKTYDEHMDNEIEIDNEDLIKDKKETKKIKSFIPPEIKEFKDYFIENKFSPDLAERAWKGYDAAEWKDSKGNQIKNWKQKCQHVWFNDQNKNTYNNGKTTNTLKSNNGIVTPKDYGKL